MSAPPNNTPIARDTAQAAPSGPRVNGPVNVLVVDDDPRNLDVLEAILASPDYRLVRAQTANEALLALVRQEFAAIVLDIQMPETSGLDLAQLIKQRKRYRHIPIIFLTAYLHDDKDVLQGYSAGAVDYLTKPINPQILQSKVRVVVDLFRTTRALAAANAALETEVGERMRAQEELRQANTALEARVQQRTADLSRANHELRRSEERYRLILENALEYAIFTLDSEGNVTSWNAGASRILGFEEQEIVGKRLDVIFTEQDRQEGQLHLEMGRAVSKGRAQDERWHLRKDGSPFWATGLMMPLKDDDGQHLGFLKILRDRTSRKLAEEALRVSEERFRSLVLALPAAVYTTDAEGRINLFNDAAVALWGRRPEIGVDKWCGSSRILRPDGSLLPHDECPMAVALREGRSLRDQEIIVERADGQRAFVLATPEPLRDASGQVVGGVNMLVDITERKQAEEARSRLAAIVESSADAILSKDLQGVIRHWNAGAQRLFGYAPEEIIGRPVTVLIPPDRHQEEARILERLRAGDRVEHFETVRVSKSGQCVDVSSTISPIRDDTGRIVGASHIAREISERKRVEKALAERARLLDLSNDAILVRDANGRIIYWNHGAEEIYGRSREEALGQNAFELLRTESREPLERILAQFHRDGRWSGELFHTRGDGTRITVAARWSMDRDSEGRPAAVLETANDMTARIQAEERFVQLNSTLVSVMESIPDALFVTNAEEQIRFRNPAASRFSQALGLDQQLPTPVEDELKRAMQTGEHLVPTSLKTVHRFLINREERFFLSRILCMVTPQNQAFGAVVMLQDVTELRLLDDVKTNLISTVSHELKTPITSLRTALLLLQEQSVGTLNESQREMVGIARDEAERLLHTLNSLLDLTRFEEGATGMRLAKVPPPELVEAALEEVESMAADSGVTLSAEFASSLPAVPMDRDRILHVLTNLLANAIKYSPPGSKVIVRVQGQEDALCFTVIDQGLGIPPAYHSRIFEKFFRVPGTTKKGAGLGLSIAREFVRAHRGQIGVRSELGQGSEFYFILPLD